MPPGLSKLWKDTGEKLTDLASSLKVQDSIMAGIISKLKSVGNPPKPPPLEANPITQYFEVGNEVTTCGAGLSWKVHDAYRKSDGMECSVFIFEKSLAEKIYKPTKQKKEKELMIDCIRNSIIMLENFRHPKMLQVLHSVEEGATTLAFASEPILASLHDVLTWQENNPQPSDPSPILPMPTCYSPPPLVGEDKPDEPPKVKNYWFLDIEIRYGLLQIIDALNYLHYTVRMVHRNISPHSILIGKHGTWKLFGLEFVENIVSIDPTDMINVPPYNIKTSKVAQPHLDYMSPEAQINGQCNILSDMFSLGLVICSIFNQGKPLLQAGCNPMSYMKQAEHLSEQLKMILPRIPHALQEAVSRLLSKDPHPRPTTQLLPLIKYFKCKSEPVINALQFLDVATTKDANQRCYFYKVTLMEILPFVPQKLLWMHVWPSLQAEVKVGEVVGSVLVPIMWLVEESSQDEFEELILPTLKHIYCRNLMTNPKSVLASVAFLEHMHILLKKCANDEAYSEIVPLLVTALDINTVNPQHPDDPPPARLTSCPTSRQMAALVALQNCADLIDNNVLQAYILGKVRTLLERHSGDLKIIRLILCFYEKVLHRLEKRHLMDHVIPTMLAMKLNDPDIISRVVKLYKVMITDKRYGLPSEIMAESMLPSLAPQAVNPHLSMEQYHSLVEILYDLLDHVDRIQRAVVASGGHTMPRIERPSRALFHRRSTDNIVDPPPFNIPNLRVERERKTSSAEDMARKASISGPNIQPTPSQSSVGTGIKKIGQWFFGSNNSTNSNNNDNNFLRVASNVFPNRRLSDNTLLSPRNRVGATASCSSSPGGTPGGAAGLPTRRHSSIGPQERRASNANLSPPTVSRAMPANQYRGRGGSGSSLSVPATAHPVGGSMPNTASSAPYLGASNTSVASGRGSRRPSACPSTASHVSHVSHKSRASHASHHSHASQASGNILQQIQTGVVRHLPSVPPRSIRVARPRPATSGPSQWLSNALAAGNNALTAGNNVLQETIRKCPSLNINFTR